MPDEKTTTATSPAATQPPAAPTVKPAAAQPGDVERLTGQLSEATAYIRKLEGRLAAGQGGLAQQLFLQNLGMVNAPNVTKAWEWTEEQLKFLQSKDVA